MPHNELSHRFVLTISFLNGAHTGMAIERHPKPCKRQFVVDPPVFRGRPYILAASYDDHNRHFGIAKAVVHQTVVFAHGFGRLFIAPDDVDEQVDTSSTG